MKFLTVFCASFAIICALPSGLTSGIFYRADAPILRQYHAQGELGDYSYGYNAGYSGKVETKSIDGVTRGSYSYVDSNGILQTVEYTADALNGFRASATNLPRAPMDNALAPEPVKDTPEVAQARADHMAIFNKEAMRTPTEDDTVETMAAPTAAPIAQIGQITRIDPINGGFIALRTAEYPRTAFSYQYSSPAYAYTTGNALYANAPYLSFGAPLAFRSPLAIRPEALEIRPAPLEIRPAPLEIRSAPLELRTPSETPEVALARAQHLAAVEEEKARIAARN